MEKRDKCAKSKWMKGVSAILSGKRGQVKHLPPSSTNFEFMYQIQDHLLPSTIHLTQFRKKCYLPPSSTQPFKCWDFKRRRGRSLQQILRDVVVSATGEKNRISKTTCHICHKYVCWEHTVFTCSQCAEVDGDDSTSD
ncbi:hypothetical protein J6590_099950 [Homalodisca vitripennis]|nr:hypothetical protein J6590_099950 [Homalodisca vitripennis]